MNERAYFDWNATAPLRREGREALLRALEVTGNASSVHAEGRAARRLIEEARAQVAALTGAAAKNVTFTASATEANMLALNPAIGPGAPRLMDASGVARFIRHYERLTRHILAEMPERADVVVRLDENRAPLEISRNAAASR